MCYKNINPNPIKMKRTTILLIFIAFTLNAISQTDTLNVSAEEQLFQGTYEVEDPQTVSVTFCFSNFTTVKRHRYHAHGSGLFAGFSNLSTRSLTEIGAVEDAEIKYSSYEIGLTLFGMDVQLSKKHGWLFFAGLGFKVQQYNADLNYAFVMNSINNRTEQVRPDALFYNKSRMVQWYMHLPIMFEYQKKFARRSNFFVQAGVELGLKLSSKSSVVYRDEDNKRIKEKMGSGMNVNPLTLDAKVEIGFNSFGLYARYGLIELFRQDRGAEVIPVAAGVIWHF